MPELRVPGRGSCPVEKTVVVETAPHAAIAQLDRASVYGGDGQSPQEVWPRPDQNSAHELTLSGNAGEPAPAERWLPVVGFETSHEVSDLGRVRRLGGRCVKASLTSDGYLSLTLRAGGRHKTRTVHLLVADAFLGPRAKGFEVDHVDGDRANARLSNLEAVTHAENVRRGIARRHATPARPFIGWPSRRYVRTAPIWSAKDLPWDPAIHGSEVVERVSGDEPSHAPASVVTP